MFATSAVTYLTLPTYLTAQGSLYIGTQGEMTATLRLRLSKTGYALFGSSS